MNPNIPTINCPKESGFYKAMQFHSEKGNIYVRLKPRDEGIYAIGIASDFLIEAGVEYELRNAAVFPKGNEVELSGAGRVEIDLEHKTATCFGCIAGYARGINQDELETLRHLLPEWDIKYDANRVQWEQ